MGAGVQSSVRSIPAYAGEPARHSGRSGQLGVYPRVCGGTARAGLRRRYVAGLSPRMRGNPSRRIDTIISPRSIPAYAGEPALCAAPIANYPVYPRVCGGTIQQPDNAEGVNGLSPRMRGNPGRPGRAGRPFRSIPAYAGEPLTS